MVDKQCVGDDLREAVAERLLARVRSSLGRGRLAVNAELSRCGLMMDDALGEALGEAVTGMAGALGEAPSRCGACLWRPLCGMREMESQHYERGRCMDFLSADTPGWDLAFEVGPVSGSHLSPLLRYEGGAIRRDITLIPLYEGFADPPLPSPPPLLGLAGKREAVEEVVRLVKAWRRLKASVNNENDHRLRQQYPLLLGNPFCQIGIARAAAGSLGLLVNRVRPDIKGGETWDGYITRCAGLLERLRRRLEEEAGARLGPDAPCEEKVRLIINAIGHGALLANGYKGDVGWFASVFWPGMTLEGIVNRHLSSVATAEGQIGDADFLKEAIRERKEASHADT